MATPKHNGGNNMPGKMTAQDKEFQAEDDARTLEQFAELKGDQIRMKSAKKVITKRQSDLNAVSEMFSKSMSDKGKDEK